MEVVLIKKKQNLKIYQGTLDYLGEEMYYFATVINDKITDMVVHTIDNETHTFNVTNEETKERMVNLLYRDMVDEGYLEEEWELQ